MIITSVNNEHIKKICKLREKKEIDKTNTFLVEGEHLVGEALKHNIIKELIILDKDYDLLKEKYPCSNTIVVNDNVMKKISNMDSYPSIIGIASKIEEKEVFGNVLILEDIQDPGNLGTIIRSSRAFNIDTIILSPKCVSLYNSKVIRSTQGILFSINIIVSPICEKIKYLKEKGYKIYGTNVVSGIEAKNIKDKTKFALIIGNEGKGMSLELSRLCDKNLYIKMDERVESLNAGVAASILLYELSK